MDRSRLFAGRLLPTGKQFWPAGMTLTIIYAQIETVLSDLSLVRPGWEMSPSASR